MELLKTHPVHPCRCVIVAEEGPVMNAGDGVRAAYSVLLRVKSVSGQGNGSLKKELAQGDIAKL